MRTPTYITDVTVVIRSVGERTEAACRNLLARQVPEDNIVIVSNAPFSATLADCYRAGIERGLPWTLCIDADVLVRPYAVSELLNVACDLPAEVCEVQGMVLDKFFGVRRPAGNHLYRTPLLPKALDLIPSEGEDIRPEFYTLNRMVEQGHPWVETPLVLGLHDFEQYHRDIFRKCYVHSHKWGEQMHLLVEYWRRVAVQDPDYRVALWGLAAGIADTGEIQVDVRRDYDFSKWVADGKWTEKRALEPGQITPGVIEATLAEWTSPGEALERFVSSHMKGIIVHGGNRLRPKSRGQRLREMKEELGLTMMLPWLAGWSLSWAGRKLMAEARHYGE